MNRVLYKLWLWFWHLLPANPILVRVVHGGSRRTRHLWMRFGYLAALLIVVSIVLGPAMSGACRSHAAAAAEPPIPAKGALPRLSAWSRSAAGHCALGRQRRVSPQR